MESGTIWLRKSTIPFLQLWIWIFQLINSFSTLASSVNSNSFAVADTTIMVGGSELDVKNHLLPENIFHLPGSTTYYSSDLALTDVGIWYVPMSHTPSSLPANVYELIFVCRLTITNTGTDTIHSFYAKCRKLSLWTLRQFQILERIQQFKYCSGANHALAIDTLNEYGMYIPHFLLLTNFVHGFPVQITNLIVTPPMIICDTIVYEAPVGISEIQNENPVHIYPNPFVSEITIQFSDENGIGSEYEIYSIYGKEGTFGPCYDNETNINLSSLSSGYTWSISWVRNSASLRKDYQIINIALKNNNSLTRLLRPSQKPSTWMRRLCSFIILAFSFTLVYGQKVTSFTEKKDYKIEEKITVEFEVKAEVDSNTNLICDGFTIVKGPSKALLIPITNGKIENSYRLTYVLKANRVGEIWVPTVFT